MEYRTAADIDFERPGADESYVLSPLLRRLLVKRGGRIYELLETDSHRTKILLNVEAWDLPDELLAEAFYLAGRFDGCVRLLENNVEALDMVISLHYEGYDLLLDFIQLAKTIRARKEIEDVMLEIRNAQK